MSGNARLRAAFSALIVTISVLVAVPVIAAAADDKVEPCDVGQTCPPEVTVTITETPGAPAPSQTGSPVVTETVTVTPTPSTSPSPSHSPTPSPEPNPIETTTAAPIPDVVDTTPDPEPSKEEEPDVSLPEASDSPTDAVTAPTEFGDPTPDDAAYELRNATPEFDQVTLSHKLAVPAALLVLIALFGWLVFEGRLRRMAHAAAVRKGGPAAATPAVAAAGPAYAPMVGFVPVPVAYPPAYGYPYAGEQPYGYPQGYPMAPQQGYPPHHGYPAQQAYGMPQGYGMAPGYGVAPQAQQPDAWSYAVNEPDPAARPQTPQAPGNAAPGTTGVDATAPYPTQGPGQPG
ncbi:hypothetical protein [Microtetraspora niveoalba]|uniref:hypothetical protein n=1 Tax=Microtetraspora niveoalba TaxID=46175 RepID=UPI0008334592|nr:hypothetical protein [Microtetraspora niveoalba]